MLHVITCSMYLFLFQSFCSACNRFIFILNFVSVHMYCVTVYIAGYNSQNPVSLKTSGKLNSPKVSHVKEHYTCTCVLVNDTIHVHVA